MALLARREDFEPATEGEGRAALYYDPETGKGYQRYPFFSDRIDRLRGRFAPNGQKLAIWGCGFGYLVELAVLVGYDAYGFDASQYAIDRGKTLLPGYASRLFVRDALVPADMTPARRDAGLAGNRRFDLLVTEDLLTSLSDAEIPTAVANLRGISAANLLHVVWPLDPTTSQDPRLTWKPIGEEQPAPPGSWRALLCPPDLVYDAVSHRIWDANGEVV